MCRGISINISYKTEKKTIFWQQCSNLTSLSGLWGSMSVTTCPFLTNIAWESPSQATVNCWPWISTATPVLPLRRRCWHTKFCIIDSSEAYAVWYRRWKQHVAEHYTPLSWLCVWTCRLCSWRQLWKLCQHHFAASPVCLEQHGGEWQRKWRHLPLHVHRTQRNRHAQLHPRRGLDRGWVTRNIDQEKLLTSVAWFVGGVYLDTEKLVEFS